MTTFTDGPMTGKALELERCPIFLRATFDHQTQKWDALDKRDDEPKATEQLFAYVLEKDPVRGFIRKTGGGGAFFVAGYCLCSPQPNDDQMRTLEGWRAWVAGNLNQVPPATSVMFT